MNASFPLSQPDLTHEDIDAVIRVLRGSRLSLGPQLSAFEEAVCRYTGSRFGIAVNSGTSGLHLCVKAAGVQAGDEVLTTPFSFVASANVILLERAVPVFVDIDPVSYNIDVSQLPGSVTSRTRAILPVHVFGRPCGIREIIHFSRRQGLAVIEDACEAIGARVDQRAVGTFGQTGVFAFYPNKQMTTGEGGMIVTDDEDIAKACRSWRNQGRDENSRWLQHERLGFNYRLSDINCALGISQLRRLPGMLTARKRVAAQYAELLSDVPQVMIPAPQAPGTELSWFVYVIRLQDEFTREDRDYVLEILRGRGIECSNYFSPIHLQPFYRKMFGFRKGDFPVTEHISERTIALPFFNRLSESGVDYICKSLRQVLSTLSASNRVAASA